MIDKLSGRMTGVLTVVTALFLIAAVGLGAAVATETVTIDDPEQEEIETVVDFDGTEDATVDVTVTEIETDDVVETQTIDYVAADHDDDLNTETVTTSVEASGDYEVDVTETTDSTTTITATNTVVDLPYTVGEDDSLIVDLDFEGENDATVEVDVLDAETDDVVETQTVEYVAADHDEGALLTAEFDTLDAGDYDVVVTVTEGDDTALVDQWIEVSGGDTVVGGGLESAGEWIEDASPLQLFAVLLLAVAGAVVAAREGWI